MKEEEGGNTRCSWPLSGIELREPHDPHWNVIHDTYNGFLTVRI